MKSYLREHRVEIGSTISITGQLEKFQEKFQLNIHKIRVVKS
jgi:hypothetical protein